jgi:hypothetical protein
MSKALISASSERRIQELVAFAEGNLAELGQSGTMTVQGGHMINKMHGMLLYIRDRQRFERDYEKIGTALVQIDLTGQQRKVMNMAYRKLGKLAFAVQELVLARSHDRTMALIESDKTGKHAAIAASQHGQAREATELVRQNRRSWWMKETAAAGGALVAASGTTAASYFLASPARWVNGGVKVLGTWLTNPSGYCTAVARQVTKKGWTGEYTETVYDASSNLGCGVLDSLGSGLGGLAASAGSVGTGTLLLLFIVALLFFYLILKLGQRSFRVRGWGMGVEMSFNGRRKSRRRSRRKRSATKRRSRRRSKSRRKSRKKSRRRKSRKKSRRRKSRKKSRRRSRRRSKSRKKSRRRSRRRSKPRRRRRSR